MKRKNHYILVAIIWAVLTVALQVASVVCYVEVNSGVGAILGGCAVGFAFTLGGLVEKAKEIAEWNKQCDWLHSIAVSLQEMTDEEINETAKLWWQDQKEKEPFAEFDTPSEVPFEEVRNKENLQ